MEKNEQQEKIGSKYIIKEKIAFGGQANIFLVEDKDTKIEYVAKVLKTEDAETIQNEIKILIDLNNNPYIIKFIESGNDFIIRKNKLKRKMDYFILENATYGALIDYIIYKKSGFGELKSKIIFSKILEGFIYCHENHICHRDIKLENILIDKSIVPKICDFGFACVSNNNNLKDYIGTSYYKPPEINYKIPYDGFKADIFSLGVTLIVLVTGLAPFKKATKTNKSYKHIYLKNYDAFWQIFDSGLQGMTLSPEFKDLINQMLQYVPKERPEIIKVIKHPWFKELEDLKKNNKEKLSEIEGEIKKFFIDSLEGVKNQNKKEIEAKGTEMEKIHLNTRFIGDDTKNDFFTEESKAKYEETPINVNNSIKIRGNLKPVNFMNYLCKSIIEKYGNNNCYIEVKEKSKLKFEVTFDEEDNEETEEKGEKEELEEQEEKEENNLTTKIKIKLYQNLDGYLLTFNQIEGNRKDFLDKFDEISNLVKK